MSLFDESGPSKWQLVHSIFHPGVQTFLSLQPKIDGGTRYKRNPENIVGSFIIGQV